MTTSITAAQLDQLKRLGTATIHEAQGQRGAVDPRIAPLDPSMRLAGPALTVDIRPGDNLMIHYALTKARPGDVLVVDAKAFVDAGPWGDVLTFAAQQIGIAGLVIDGAVRDASQIVEMGFPVFCRGLSIRGTNKHQPGKLNLPLVLGGAVVRPGDIVVGDRDGLVIVAAEEVPEVIAASAAREQKEAQMRERLAQGATMVELLGLRETLASLGLR
ncbi:4-hydroxy-4-methyl-2-oxoglutarate aldolase [compost metagenome]|uniref:Putative 4-hydroxy-4-methyl-2-oxoglutarate aldolase n=1 Tax=Cupriavidus campinensis TaxID=151783 RepID=A0AAE9I6Q5_9BURK|nr:MULTISPECIES: 4-carboxy-4-hydroxy-2-oxoadipate aldolase/oxaloacetate decarboxylase [Cupriavidus]TSP11272.1 RraA family protein [Cupriavidus campinensis]URF07336.1 4-carboxy-4-hydroxy-2-oxoadipate aldolase/oxaloacetate decarboxylase [Cupriavidus campinensis]CAG2143010.1 4-carboxy-4-hydroxy-2-oxoadipate aldolase [Cupriavidus campinensis]